MELHWRTCDRRFIVHRHPEARESKLCPTKTISIFGRVKVSRIFVFYSLPKQRRKNLRLCRHSADHLQDSLYFALRWPPLESRRSCSVHVQFLGITLSVSRTRISH